MAKRKKKPHQPSEPLASEAASPPSSGLSKTQKRKLQKKRAQQTAAAARAAAAAEKQQQQQQQKAAAAAAAAAAPSSILSVVHEDDHVVAINKPAGLLAHPSPGYWDHGTVVHALESRERVQGYSPIGSHMLEARQSYTGEADSFIPRAIVHRLDKGTTGLMLIAKTEPAEAHLAEHFKRRTAPKTYIALLRGKPRADAVDGVSHGDPAARDRGATAAAALHVNASIGRDPERPGKMRVAEDGKAARSVVRMHGWREGISLVSVDIYSGRQHQIRVHCAHLSAPILDDDAYGSAIPQDLRARLGLAPMRGRGRPRPLLHAWAMQVTWPPPGGSHVTAHTGTGAPPGNLHLSAPLPADMRAIVRQLWPDLADAEPGEWPVIAS
jgi:23S rRNA pseudouridine1911/1915/1917 synthase